MNKRRSREVSPERAAGPLAPGKSSVLRNAWALQDSNFPRNSRRKPKVPGTGAVKSAASSEHAGPAQAAPDTPSAADEADADLARVLAAWSKLGEEPRQAVLEIIGRAERWWQFVAWAGQTAAHLIAVGLRAGWDFRGKPRPARTGSWYLSFERGGHKLCIRLANHHRRIANIVNVVWERGHEKALAEALRKLRAPVNDAAASASAAG